MESVSVAGRDKAPVFIVGSARSGITLLYHILLASGHFANYRSEPAVFDLFLPKFGTFRRRRTRKKLMRLWRRNAMFRASGLDGDEATKAVIERCSNVGDFLRIIMSAVARQQGLDRWAVWGPDNLLYIPEIKKAIPEALIIHMIRDGRDVAVSMHKEGWIRPFPWDRDQGLLVAGLHWQWKVNTGRRSRICCGSDYLELRFEDLLADPRPVLTRVGDFVGQKLDYEFIRKHPVGTLARPNSTFQDECRNNQLAPVGRWKRTLSDSEKRSLEAAIGATLVDLGYKNESSEQVSMPLRIELIRWLYPWYFTTKHWLKTRTFLGRFVSEYRLHLSS